MKLWVRSQNKDSLVVADCVFYAEGCTYNIYTNCCEGTFTLGCYESEKRCLEIIDEIQELLKLGNPENAFMIFNDCDFLSRDEADEILKRVRTDKAVFTSKEGFSVVMPSVVVYEMPEK